MHILRRLPFRDVAFNLEVAGEFVMIKPYQIVVWVSLSARENLEVGCQRFPVILDTGHNHNFSISENKLHRWAGLHKELFPSLGNIIVNRQEIPLIAGYVWLHRNKSGTVDLLDKPFRLDVPQGIAVYSDNAPGVPRLPLLGLRGIVKSKLRLTIDGQPLLISLQGKKHKTF